MHHVVMMKTLSYLVTLWTSWMKVSFQMGSKVLGLVLERSSWCSSASIDTYGSIGWSSEHTHVNTYNTNTHFRKHATPISHIEYTQNHHWWRVILHEIGTEKPRPRIYVRRRASPGFPKVMLCRFWKSVGRSPVASQIFTITVPLNMVNYCEPVPPHDHFHTIDSLKIIDGASF